MSQRDRENPKSGQFAILRFALQVEVHANEKQALRRLDELEKFERVALVDLEMGYTRCLRQHYHFVAERLQQDDTPPVDPVRTGPLGDYLRRRLREA